MLGLTPIITKFKPNAIEEGNANILHDELLITSRAIFMKLFI